MNESRSVYASSSQITVWVEDDLSKQYLSELWRHDYLTI